MLAQVVLAGTGHETPMFGVRVSKACFAIAGGLNRNMTQHTKDVQGKEGMRETSGLG